MDKEKVNKVLHDTLKTLLDQGLTGEEYLLVLQTMIAQVLAANGPQVKRIFLLNLNADVRARRIDGLKKHG